ncbi:hypothetical protein [Yinghuangia sp. YIM S10712]|uniref:hypothetical protein n=1 Tax=Yinghuangia sp. YIM S10712 TaxID=3436930 RepID=UPI003F53B6D5
MPEDWNAWRSEPPGPVAPDVESVHADSVAWLNDLEETYGSAEGAKCWPERPTMWTDKCALGAAKAGEAARSSLQRIKHEPAGYFTTLRANAAKVTTAVTAYQSGNCASVPASSAKRAKCQEAAYTIAQAYIYLRAGFNAALAGH